MGRRGASRTRADRSTPPRADPHSRPGPGAEGVRRDRHRHQRTGRLLCACRSCTWSARSGELDRVLAPTGHVAGVEQQVQTWHLRRHGPNRLDRAQDRPGPRLDPQARGAPIRPHRPLPATGLVVRRGARMPGKRHERDPVADRETDRSGPRHREIDVVEAEPSRPERRQRRRGRRQGHVHDPQRPGPRSLVSAPCTSRLCISQISSWNWSVDEDLAFYADHDIHTIGVSLRKPTPRPGRVGEPDPSRRRGGRRPHRGRALSLDQPEEWPHQQARLLAAIDLARHLDAGCLVLTTGPAGALTWEEAAVAFGRATVEGSGPGRRNGRPAGPRAHQLPPPRRRLRAHPPGRHRPRPPPRHRRVHGDQRLLGERKLADSIAGGVDALRVVQLSDYAIGTTRRRIGSCPATGDIPLRHPRPGLEGRLRGGCSTWSWSAPASTRRATPQRSRARSPTSTACWPNSTREASDSDARRVENEQAQRYWAAELALDDLAVGVARELVDELPRRGRL